MTFSNLVVALAVLAFLLVRQLQPRAVREDRSWTGVAIIAVLGVYQVAQFADRHTVPASAWGVIVLGLATGVGFGLLRANLMHLWRGEDGVLMRQGTAVTAALWLIGAAVHVGLDVVIDRVAPSAHGLGWASLTAYLAVSFATQRVHLLGRTRRLDGAAAGLPTQSRS